MQLILLQNAVEEGGTDRSRPTISSYMSPRATYTQYVQLLTISAVQLDKKKPTAGTTRSRQRNVYSTDFNPYDIDTDI